MKEESIIEAVLSGNGAVETVFAPVSRTVFSGNENIAMDL